MGGYNFGNTLPIDLTKCHVKGESLWFLIWKLSKTSEFHYVEPLLYFSIRDIVEAMNTLSQERHNHNESFILVKKSRSTQKNGIYLANQRYGLAFFCMDLGHNLGAMQAMSLECCWEERDLINQNLLTALSAYLLSWYTRTLLSTILSKTRKIPCCVAFLSFQSSKLETL